MSAKIDAVQQEFTIAWNQGGLDVIDDLYAPDYVGHSTTQTIEGPDGRKAYIEMFRTAFPDGKITVDDLIYAEDTVVARYTWTGTHEGELMGVPPTSNEVEVSAVAITRFEDDTIIEQWIFGDVYGLLKQLDAVPA